MAVTINLDEIGNPEAKRFGTRLKAQRKALNLSQAQLHERTGITSAYISMIERKGGNPTLDMLIRLSEAVGLEAWKMLHPSTNPPD